ncbi:MAG: hypothetical protein R2867_37740 [Caldilineaceae bacterium]
MANIFATWRSTVRTRGWLRPKGLLCLGKCVRNRGLHRQPLSYAPQRREARRRQLRVEQRGVVVDLEAFGAPDLGVIVHQK